MADKTNNAFVMINTLMLRMGNSSKDGIDAQAMVGLATCSRNLNKKREILAEVHRSVQVLEAEQGPDQLTRGLYLSHNTTFHPNHPLKFFAKSDFNFFIWCLSQIPLSAEACLH